MTSPKPRMIFVNLAVNDLPRSVAFFRELGFSFDPRFCDDNGHCMVIREDASYVMLLQEPFFRTFTQREPADTSRVNETLLALSCESREEVDRLADKALELGGSEAMPAKDHDFMYYRTFYDLDGHHWELMWMDPSNAPS